MFHGDDFKMFHGGGFQGDDANSGRQTTQAMMRKRMHSKMTRTDDKEGAWNERILVVTNAFFRSVTAPSSRL